MTFHTSVLILNAVLSASGIVVILLVVFAPRKQREKPEPKARPVRPDPPPPMPPQYTVETVEGSLTMWHPRQVSACIFPTDYENCQNRMTDGKCTSFVCTKIVRFRKDPL